MASKKREEEEDETLSEETRYRLNAASNCKDQLDFNAAVLNLLENYNGKFVKQFWSLAPPVH